MDRNNQNIMKVLHGIVDVNSDFLYEIIEPKNNVILADEIFITDGEGIVLRISETYEKNFNIKSNTIIGKSVFDLEAEGMFKPCITATVIRQKKKIITTQTINGTHTAMTTGIPVFDETKNIKYVVCFNTITMEHVNSIQEKYNQLKDSINKYTAELMVLRQKNTYHDLVIKSKSMQNIWDTLCYTANTKVNVLFTGETGVGKSAIAKAIHKMSDRKDQPFVEINCAVIHENLIESELFGYEKGAFTGANPTGKIGKIELANHGTLFLDEIGELSLSLQTKLLQLIQDKTIERLSGYKKIEVDFKLICATNKNLEKEVEAGTFRRDLYYRLNVLRIQIPPLRERRADICLLAQQFLEHFNHEYNKNKYFSTKLMDFLEQHPWPGNVRQLENLIERLVITRVNEKIEIFDLPYDFMHGSNKETFIDKQNKNLFELIEDYERQLILDSYCLHKTSVAVAHDLGISQATAARKLSKYIKIV